MDHFSLVFEPEAASIYAKSLPLEKVMGDNNAFVLKAFDPGKKFIVVDGGGMWNLFRIYKFQKTYL